MDAKDKYGPVEGRCKTGYHKNKTTNMCVAVKHKTKKNIKLVHCIKKCINPLVEYGPAPTRCRKGYVKNKTSKMCQDPCVKQCQNIHASHSPPIARRTPDGFEYGPKKGRCKIGYYKNKTTKMCVKGRAKPQKTKSPHVKHSPTHTYGPVVGRCKIGYHKNKTTKMCIKGPATKKQTKKLPKTPKTLPPKETSSRTPGSNMPIVIKDTTPPELLQLSIEVETEMSKKTPVSVTRLKSYSPAINKQLISKKSDDKVDIFGTCKILEKYGANMFRTTRLVKPTIWNGTKCIGYDTKGAQVILLSNLASTKLTPIETIIAPKQYRANCWFNTMFMILFVSDKGRKFFKFFRQLMIEGKTMRSGLVKNPKIPPRSWKAFALLNLAVEATLSGNRTIMTFDTNTIISEIYRSLPLHRGRYPVDRAGNPMVYYSALMDYLRSGNNVMQMLRIEAPTFDLLQQQKTVLLSTKQFPEMIQVNMHCGDDGDILDVRNRITIKNDKNETQTYELDSAALIDTVGRHFCCLITYDKQEYGFDGASFKRLNPFKWKRLINTNQDWTFEGSTFKPSNEPILWNFKNGFVQLFYYRV